MYETTYQDQINKLMLQSDLDLTSSFSSLWKKGLEGRVIASVTKKYSRYTQQATLGA